MTLEEFLSDALEDDVTCGCVTCKTDARDRLTRLWNAAAAEEREACAKIADDHECDCYDDLCQVPIAAAIRARGNQ